MNDNDKKLYIPVNVLETKDIIPGIGGKELAAIGIAAAVGVIISIVVYAVNNNMVTCLMIIAFASTATFIAVRRDNHNENIINKIVQIYRYANAQKRFEYEYMGIKSPWEDEQ